MALSDIVSRTDPFSEDSDEAVINKSESMLIDWVTSRVKQWTDARDSNYKNRWAEYYRLWRGIWSSEDKTRDSERSRLISPALQQAIEVQVSEIEEATFGKGRWFDIDDDIMDQQPNDVLLFRKLLEEDLERSKIKSAISEIYFLGTLYGTGIGKIISEEISDYVIDPKSTNSPMEPATASEITRFQTRLVPVEPMEFAIDPTARTIEEALGCAHILMVPKHSVVSKQARGIYFPGRLGSSSQIEDVAAKGEMKDNNDADRVKIIEYHGLVPEKLLMAATLNEDEELVELTDSEDIEDETLVEAIITIGNDNILLKAVENPYLMKDRSFVAYQHETVPGRFWGRGVAEKGYNIQKALDAELRGRIDAMAYAIHPMMGVDATRIPKGHDLSVKPGKSILTIGDPATVLRPFNWNNVTQATFTQAGELERMLQMGTGSMDSAAPVGVSPRNATASGMSMILSGAIKRSKRTLSNIERNFTTPLINKAAWRYMQFDSERYPVTDVKFKVVSTLGIMAREFEQGQLTQLLNTVPPNSPAYWMLIRGIYQNSSIQDKEEMIQIANQMLQSAMNPAPDPVQMMELKLKQIASQQETAKILLDAQRLENDGIKKQAEAILNIAKAEAQEIGSQLDAYRSVVESLEPRRGKLNGPTGEEGV